MQGKEEEEGSGKEEQVIKANNYENENNGLQEKVMEMDKNKNDDKNKRKQKKKRKKEREGEEDDEDEDGKI